MVCQGTMILPRNAVAMNEEEMRYVEGGYAINLSRSFVQKSIDVAILIAGTALGGSATIGKLVAKIGKSKFVSRALKACSKLGISAKWANAAVGAFGIVTGWSIGGGIAYLLDRYDKTGVNNRIQFG